MADVKATALSTTQAFDPNTDYLMAVRGDADGPRSGPYLVPGLSVSVGSAASGGDGGTTTPPPATGSITKVFGRTGPEINAATSDYDANQIDYDPTTSGLAADNVQTAIDAVAALRDTLPVPETDGDLLTATGGTWTAQPPAVVSVFGGEGVIGAEFGQYHSDLIAVTKVVGEDPNVACDNLFVTAAQIAKLTALDEDLQVPDPTAATLGHVLTVVDDGGTNVAEFAAPAASSGGGGLSQIDLFPYLRPDSSSPPLWVYASGTATWEFTNSGTLPLYAEIDYWPGGTATINFTFSCSATSGNAGFQVQIAAVTPGSGDLWDKALVSATPGSTAVADAVKKTKRVTITISGIDGVAEGDLVRIKLWRDNTVGSNAAGTAVLRGCTLRFSFA